MGNAIPFVSLAVGTVTEAGTGDCVICDAIPFNSLAVGTETGTEVENGVIYDAILFDSLAAGTEAGTEEPTPQSPTIPISTPIAIPPLGASRPRS